jgi:hypothetical protein
VLDYLAAGLPVVCTSNDALSAFVEANGFGRAVEPRDVGGCAKAFDELTGPGKTRLDNRARLAPLHWPSVAAPLVDYCLRPSARPRRRSTSVAVAARQYPAFARAVYEEGSPSDFLRTVLRRLQRSAARRMLR